MSMPWIAVTSQCLHKQNTGCITGIIFYRYCIMFYYRYCSGLSVQPFPLGALMSKIGSSLDSSYPLLSLSFLLSLPLADFRFGARWSCVLAEWSYQPVSDWMMSSPLLSGSSPGSSGASESTDLFRDLCGRLKDCHDSALQGRPTVYMPGNLHQNN